MRWVLALAFCIAAAVAIWIGFREDNSNLRLTIHEALPRPDVGDPNLLGRQLWTVRPRFSVEPPCAGARISAGTRTLLNGRPAPGGFEGDGGYEGDGYSGYTVEFSARVTCRDGRHAEARREFLLPPASCEGGPLRVYEVRGSAAVREYAFADRAPQVSLAEGHYVGVDSVVEVPPGGRVEIAAPECNRLRLVFGAGTYQIGSYERGTGGNWFAGPGVVAVGDRHGGRFFVEPEDGRPSPAHVMPLTARPSSYAVRRVGGRVIVRVYEGVVGVTGRDERHVVRVGRFHQVSVLYGAARPSRPRLFQPNEPWVLEPPRGLARLAPRLATFSARRLVASGGAPEQMLVTWSRSSRTRHGVGSERQGVWIWERKAGWHRVYAHQAPFGNTETSVGDVTSDGHADVLISESQGTGACGVRRLVAFAAGRTSELFARDFCEGHARIIGGMLRVQEAVGPCPYKEMGAHCRGGLRTTALRWEGARLRSAKKTVRCNLARLDPARNCVPKPKLNTP